MTAPECLTEFFESVFMDNTEEEALAVWSYLCTGTSPKPEELLRCVEQAVADPPEDLVDVMQESGWVYLNHETDDGDLTQYTFDEYVAWLRDLVPELRRRFEEARSAS